MSSGKEMIQKYPAAKAVARKIIHTSEKVTGGVALGRCTCLYVDNMLTTYIYIHVYVHMYNIISTAVHSQSFSLSLYSDSSKVVAKLASATGDNLVAGGASDPLHL